MGCRSDASRLGMVRPVGLPARIVVGVLVALSFTASTARAGVWSIDGLAPLVGPQSQQTADGYLGTDSCVSTGFCMALGVDDTGGLTRQTTLEETYTGGTWTRVPGPPGFRRTYPAAVSCASPVYCMAVGTSAAVWNGTSWRLMSSHARTDLTAVSCGVTTCVAVGDRGRSLTPVAELWRNGVSRSIAQPIKGLDPASIWCAGASRCLVAGDYTCPESGPCPHPRPFAESWNGHSWAVMKGATGSRRAIDQLSCVSPRWCLGVEGEKTARWNGRRWSSPSAGAGLGFEATQVSCVTETSCEAIGLAPRSGGRGGGVPAASHWDGHGWAREPVPLPHGPGPALSAVSCASVTLCTAVGRFGRATQTPLAESWQAG